MGLNPISDAAVELVKSTVGNVVNKLADHYLPPSMSDKEKEEFRLKAQELALKEIEVTAAAEKVYADDRNSARQREMAVKDRTPSVLAFVSFAGFFGILLTMIFVDLPEKAHDPLMIMLGILGATITGVVQYYYGSSSGSAKKDEAIHEALRGK